ncbi:MAG: porin [Alcanivorax sp.]|nr:porin [Alcanivorax sp.]
MKKTTFKTTLISSALLASSGAWAQSDGNKPTFFGEMGMGALKVDSRDLDTWAFDLTAGFKGLYKANGLKVAYTFNADFTGPVNDIDPLVYTRGGDDDTIYIRNAKVVLPTQYGAFVFGPRSSSGQYGDLYGAVTDFEYNELHARTGINRMFTQGDIINNLLAYASPTFAGWKLIVGSFTFNKYNDRDIDAMSYRALYSNGGFNFAFGQVLISDDQAATGEEEERNAATASYQWDHLSLMATVEQNDVPDGTVNDFTTYAVGGRYRINDNWSTALTYADKNHELEDLDNTAVIAQVRRHFGSQAYLFAETGQYDESPSNYAVGVNLKF